VRITLLLCLLASAAHAGDLCAPGRPHRGKVLDLAVANADLHDVLRLLAETADINLVVNQTVTGKVTLDLKHVAWDAVACTIAGLHHLRMTVDDNILLVMPIK
jgi:type IV pilus assembly protein PilQ